jgi:hypothetical protein
MIKHIRLTELDAGVVLANLVALLIGEKHVGGETTLGGIGVWILVKSASRREAHEQRTLLLLAAISLGGPALAAGYLLLRHGDVRIEL